LGAARQSAGLSEPMKGVVGVVGLGIMGGAMARNLTGAGWQVVGFDVLAERRNEAEAAGIAAADDAAAPRP